METQTVGKEFMDGNVTVSVKYILSKGTFEFNDQENGEAKLIKGKFTLAPGSFKVESYSIEGYPERKLPKEIVEPMELKLELKVPEEFQE